MAEMFPRDDRGFRRSAFRRRLTVWSAIVLGIAIAGGIVALGLIVLVVAAAVGLAAWLIFAALRAFDRRRFGPRRGGINGGADDGAPGPRIEIITASGETLDGGHAEEVDRGSDADTLRPR